MVSYAADVVLLVDGCARLAGAVAEAAPVWDVCAADLSDEHTRRAGGADPARLRRGWGAGG